MSALVLIPLAVAAVALWWHLQLARRRARAAAGAVCDEAGVQLLDDTVSLVRFGWQRAPDAGLVAWYRFEFADTGARRHLGRIRVGPGRAVLVSGDELP